MQRAVALFFVSLLVSLACGSGPFDALCACARAQPVPVAARPLAVRRTPEDPGRFARGAAIGGVVTAGIMLSATLAIELADRPATEDVTRGVQLGVTILAVPALALTSFMLRRREHVEGSPALRTMGWAFYSGAVAMGVAQWYEALHGRSTPTGLSFMYVSMSLLALLPHSFDTYLAARQARSARLFRLTPTGLGLRF